MVRKILAFIAGLVTFFVVITVFQMIGGAIYGSPEPEMLTDPDGMKAYVAGLPAGAFVIVLLGYIVGSFAAGTLMRIISGADSLVLPLVLGLLGTIGWIANITLIPHPIWVAALGFLCYIPFTILGHRVAGGRE